MTTSANDAHPFPIYNARYRVIFPILDSDGDLVTAAGSLDSELSQDTGTFADATNEATEVATSSGMYYLDLVAGELDTKSTAIIVKSTGGKTTPIVLYPVRLPVIRTGTAQAGAASTITLDSSASAIDDYYNGCYVNITNNSPANAQGQARRITDYVGSTKVATVEGTYGTNPSSASTFEVLATPEWVYRFGDVLAWNSAAIVAPNAAGMPVVDVERWNSTLVPAEHTAGYPIVTIKDGTGTGEIATTSGAIDTVLAVTTVNGLAAGVITAAAIATGAIDADSLAADAGTEIGTAVWATTTRQLTHLDEDVTTIDINNTAVGSVVGAVGSVTGAVGSVGAGGITSTSIATDAIDADALAADALTEIFNKITQTALTEGYAADGATATLEQMLYMLWSALAEFSISSTTITCKKLDGSTTALTFTLDDATNPTSRTRAT
jgi:hypothetical protein